MAIQIIKCLVHFTNEKDKDFVLETIEILEDLIINEPLKYEAIDFFGGTLSS